MGTASLFCTTQHANPVLRLPHVEQRKAVTKMAEDVVTPTAALVEALPDIRARQQLTLQDLGERIIGDLGGKLDRAAISKIENRSRGVSLDEAVLLAIALDVAPVHLIIPREDDQKVTLAPNVTVTAAQAREWLRGQRALPGGDDQTYRTEVPKSEWQKGNARVVRAEDEEERCRRRYRVAKERMRLVGDRLGELDAQIARRNSPFRAGGGWIQSLTEGDPDQEERARLTRMYDAALQEVAEAKVDLDDAEDELRRIRAEEGRRIVHHPLTVSSPDAAEEGDDGSR